jgi:putative transposase
MTKDIRESGGGADSIEVRMRERIRETIEVLVEEELVEALGAGRSVRTEERQGYRHGSRERTLTTSLGPTSFSMPRARVKDEAGQAREWRSAVVPRYQRRTARVDEAILGLYLSGANTRRIRGALAPLLKGGPLSKDAVSRLVGRLAEDFKAWSERDLAAEEIRYLVQDGWYPKVRIGRQRVRVPVLVTLGVKADGQRIIVDLRLAGEESAASWGEVITALVRRNIGTLSLAMIDGNPGLHRALQTHWPGIVIQRCTNHKLWNLLSKAPAHLREELTEDYRRMIYGEDSAAVLKSRSAFQRSGSYGAPRSRAASKRRATSCSPSWHSRARSGKRFGRPMPSSASTRSSAGGRRLRPACRAATRWCSCSSACSAAVRSSYGPLTVGRTCRNR